MHRPAASSRRDGGEDKRTPGIRLQLVQVLCSLAPVVHFKAVAIDLGVCCQSMAGPHLVLAGPQCRLCGLCEVAFPVPPVSCHPVAMGVSKKWSPLQILVLVVFLCFMFATNYI